MSALESLCSDSLTKEEIRQKVNQVVCTEGDERDVSLKQGTLMFQMDADSVPDFQYVRDFLNSIMGEDEAGN